MLKDYYYYYRSFVKPSTIKTVDEILLRQACFSTYGRCRGYMKRVHSSGKVFLWHGLYHEVSEECKNNILCILKRDFNSLNDDIRFAASADYKAHCLARDGVRVPFDYGFCLDFNNEVKK